MGSTSTKISIIIPVYNEAESLGDFLDELQKRIRSEAIEEIIVVDGGSTDASQEIARSKKVGLITSPKGRPVQMNKGAAQARGDILYFLHADTLPPVGFDSLIQQSFLRGHKAGCFRMSFDSPHPLLRFFGWFTRFNYLLFRGGDQSLYIGKKEFWQLQGFNPDYRIYEDCHFIERVYRAYGFRVIPAKVITSARKYRTLGVFYLQFHFGVIHLKNYLGHRPEELYRYYQERIGSRLT